MNLFDRARGPIRSFAKEETGVAALEFALLLPLILLLLAGTVDINEALIVHRKMRQVSSTVSDLIAQQSDVTPAEVNAIMAGAATLLEPYNGTELDIVLSIVNVTKGNQVVAWSAAYQAKAEGPGKNSAFPAPSALTEDGVQMVAVKVNYKFDTMFTSYLQAFVGRGGYAMEDVMYERPRTGDTITLD